MRQMNKKENFLAEDERKRTDRIETGIFLKKYLFKKYLSCAIRVFIVIGYVSFGDIAIWLPLHDSVSGTSSISIPVL